VELEFIFNRKGFREREFINDRYVALMFFSLVPFLRYIF
jgi:hypothetical protein